MTWRGCRRVKPGSAEAGSQHWYRAWRSAHMLKRPPAALFVDFVLALLRSADDALLCQLLTIRCPTSCGIETTLHPLF